MIEVTLAVLIWGLYIFIGAYCTMYLIYSDDRPEGPCYSLAMILGLFWPLGYLIGLIYHIIKKRKE